jgi:hypothetical protein
MLSSKLTHQMLTDQAARQHSIAKQQPSLYKHAHLRCRAADRPGEHDAAKGIGSRRGSLDEQAAAAAAPAGQAPADGSSKPEAARTSEVVAVNNCEAAAQQQQQQAAAADIYDDDYDDDDEVRMCWFPACR